MEIEEFVRKADSQQAKDVLKNLLTRYLKPRFRCVTQSRGRADHSRRTGRAGGYQQRTPSLRTGHNTQGYPHQS